MLFFACIFLSVWGIKASYNLLRALQIRASALCGRVINVRGLSESLHYFDTATRGHISSLIQTRRSEPPRKMKRLFVPFQLFSVECVGRGADVYFDIWCADTTRLVLVERMNSVLLDGRDQFFSADEVIRYMKAERCIVSDGRTVGSGRHRVSFSRSGADDPSLSLLVIPLGRPSMTKTSSSAIAMNLDPNSGDSETVPSSSSPSSETAFAPLWAVGGRCNDTDEAEGTLYQDSWQCVLDFGLIMLSEQQETTAETQTSGSRGLINSDEIILCASGQLFRPQEMFGNMESGQEDGQNGDGDCVVCLTEQKEVILLPCRHMCVCQSCFVHIDKCPVCRCTFDAYLAIDLKETDTLHIPSYS